MAVRFPLEVKNGVMARNISELKENFDVEKIVGYFIDGKLKRWLNTRYYEEEAKAIEQLSKDDVELAQKLCKIFEVEYKFEEINLAEIIRRNERLAKLKQITTSEEAIKNIDFVAFNQEELEELFNGNITRIFLCDGDFSIPKAKQNLEYILIGEPTVTGLLKNPKDDCEKEDVYSMPEEVADKIGLSSFTVTNDYIVYHPRKDKQVDGKEWDSLKCKSVYDYIDLIMVYNKSTKVTTPLGTPEYYVKGDILGAIGNKVLLAESDKIKLYDLDNNKYKIVGENRAHSKWFSYEGNNIAYKKGNKRLVVQNIETNNMITVKDIYYSDQSFTIADNKVFYVDYKNHLVTYDLDKHVTTTIVEIEIVFGMFQYQRTLYVLSWHPLYETERIVTLDLDDLNSPPVEILKYGYSGENKNSHYSFSAPYLVFYNEESDSSLYLLDMEKQEIKKVAFVCGYNINRTRHVNYQFNVVGDYLYIKEGETKVGNSELFRVNLKHNDGIVVV